MSGKKMPLAVRIFIGLTVGIAAGIILINIDGGVEIANKYIKPWGTIFLNLLKFVVVPIVLLSIISGVISMRDIRKVGSIGIKTLIYYIVTTAFAIALALLLSTLAKSMHIFTPINTSDLAYKAPANQDFITTIINLFPSNIVAPLLNANMLQVIMVALFIGFGILSVGEKGKPAAAVIESFNEVFVNIIDTILNISPFAVACLICPVVAANGADILGNLAIVILVTYIGYITHAAVVYSITVKTLGNISPLKFFKEMIPAIIFAFSSSSSVSTLPINRECAEKLGADKNITSFVLPLGATINMDGTAIYQGVCAVFIACCFGIDLTLGQMITIIITTTLASVGTAGVPGAGVIMLTMVLQSVNIPLEGIAIVAGVDRIFDMGRTVINITGDAACTIVVSGLEKKSEKN